MAVLLIPSIGREPYQVSRRRRFELIIIARSQPAGKKSAARARSRATAPHLGPGYARCQLSVVSCSCARRGSIQNPEGGIQDSRTAGRSWAARDLRRTTRPDVDGGEAGRDEANAPGVVGRIVRLKPDLLQGTRSFVPHREGLDRRILRKMMKSEEIYATFLPIVQIV